LHHVEFLIDIIVAELLIVSDIVGLATVISFRDSAQWPNSNVLVQEIFGHEIIHEVFLSNVTSIIVIFFHHDLLKLLANG
jgi:hypothetical protein